MNLPDERNVDPLNEMSYLALKVLDLDTRGFSETYRSLNSKKIIYDSEWCRISFIWGGWDYGGGNNMYIRYGRLHALNEGTKMIWNGEECYCWHDFDHALNFLDGLQPATTVRQYYSHSITDPFYEDEFRKKFSRRQPAWLAHLHMGIWQHYGVRFFELFDIRQPDLWQKYRQFLKDFYDIKGRRLGTTPSLDKVC